MNTKLLKQKILDLAIRGKLTQQLKSDGTAADLLKEIVDAKSALSQPKGKKSKDPGTIIPLDKSEAPFEIPANWEWVRLGDVCELLNGDRSSNYPNKNEYVVCGVAWINTGHIRPDGFLDEKTMNYITEEKYNSLGNGKIHKFDLVYCLRGATFGKVARVEPFEKGAVASSLMIIRPILSQMRDFLYRCLKTDFAMNQLRKFDNGSAQPNLAAKDVSRYFVPLPPLAEQQRIVAKIEEAFAEIDAIEKNKELLKTHIKQTRQKILDLAIHGKLVPQSKSDEPASVLLERITRDNPHYEKMTDVPFEIPDSWEWVKYAELVTNISVKNFQVKSSEIQPIGTFPVVSQGQSNIDGFVDDPKKVVHLRFPIVLFGDHTKIVKYIDFDFVVGADGTKVLEAKSAINPKYLYFMTLNIVEKIEDRGYGRHFALLSNSLCPLPPLAEQKRIVDRIEEIFASLDKISLHLV